MATMQGDSILGASYMDSVAFKKRNPLILRTLCILFGVIVYGCMAIGAWSWSIPDPEEIKPRVKKCLYGEGNEGVCTFGIFISFVALLAAIIFLGGEFVIDKITVMHYRLQYYFVETVFSAIWTVLFLVCFITLETQWEEEGDTDQIEKAGAASSVRAAIWFSLLSVPVWAACAYMGLQRYRVLKAELEYAAALAGRRPSAYPASTIPVSGEIPTSSTTPVPLQTTVSY